MNVSEDDGGQHTTYYSHHLGISGLGGPTQKSLTKRPMYFFDIGIDVYTKKYEVKKTSLSLIVLSCDMHLSVPAMLIRFGDLNKFKF
jgi:hypothetical protein